MSHRIHAAGEMPQEAIAQAGAPINWLVLTVHRDNQRAIRFYAKCGFELIPDVLRQRDHLVMKLWIGESGKQ